MMRTKRRVPVITRTDIVGFLFVLPFVIGVIFLFIKPMISSIVYSFSEIRFEENGMNMKLVGFANYYRALFEDASFFKALLTIGGDVLIKVAVIIFMSMFVAMLLNDRFPGRLFFRTVMFLPVIFGADIVVSMFKDSAAYTAMSGTYNSYVELGGTANRFIEELTNSFGFLSGMMGVFSSYASRMFDLTWEMGIQVVLFIVGLQAIPPYLYEVADMEGATKWETFWKITFPLLSPTMLLCVVYTVIDNFNADNSIVAMIRQNMGHLLHYACAQAWLYAVIVFVIVGVIYRLVSKWTIYLD